MTPALDKALHDVTAYLDEQNTVEAQVLRDRLLEAYDGQKASERIESARTGAVMNRGIDGLAEDIQRCDAHTKTSWGEHRCQLVSSHPKLHRCVLGHGSEISWSDKEST